MKLSNKVFLRVGWNKYSMWCVWPACFFSIYNLEDYLDGEPIESSTHVCFELRWLKGVLSIDDGY